MSTEWQRHLQVESLDNPRAASPMLLRLIASLVQRRHRIQVRQNVAATDSGFWLVSAPRSRQVSQHKTSRFRPVPAAAAGLSHQKRVVRDAGDNRGRVGVDNNLAERVTSIHGFFRIDGDIPKQLNDRLNSEWVHTILRLFEAQQSRAPRISFHDGERKEAQGAIGQGSGEVLRTVPVGHHNAHELALFVDIHPHTSHVFDKLR
jgi:hypothetical protein